MDAKVRFVFKTGTTPDANGQVIKTFTPGQWKVVNIPRKTYLMSYAQRGKTETTGQDAGATTDDFFTSNWAQFEEFPSDTQSEFSFYMLENRMTPKKTATTFPDRDRQVKLESGLNGEWEYANNLSTYVIVTGRVEMDLVNDDAGQTLGGEVQYIIHLGDFGTGGNISDFSTLRNTSYTYTVTSGWKWIRKQLKTNRERQVSLRLPKKRSPFATRITFPKLSPSTPSTSLMISRGT